MPTNKQTAAAKQFRAELERARITQTDFAKFLGKHRRTVQRWTNDGPVPNYGWYALNTLLMYGPRERKERLKKNKRYM